ncbi:histidinol-phosphate transaminase [Streptomyces acidiscabies]|uniref:Histidinol-phosphate aminotransferase n=1 Tax=Streptomyces acidiscabies TaxID=42234 RepID=A0A0L0K4S7_9ACTN|nr:histidinol-phosphate transaminase [Streptomyces acidiscabies]KND33112.1 aminotransferase [Streptomyces acidiscabies]
MYELLKTIMIDDLEVEADGLSPDASREDAGLDSLATFELSLALTERLGIKITDDELFGLTTLADIAGYVEKRIAETGSPAPARAEAREDTGLALLLGAGDVPSGGPALTHPLARNETPFPPPASVLDAITRAATEANRYPDPACGALRAELARHYDLAPDRVAVGAGSITLIQALLTVTAEPGAAVAYSWPSFDGYGVLADLAGFHSVRVPLTADGHDLDALAAAIDERTRLVLLCNPNNPTGATAGEAALLRFLASVPPTCLVVLDEAYGEFARDSGLGVRLLGAWPNLIVARTFSKAYGLAGLRVGYLLAEPHLISRVQRMVMPLSVSDIAQAAAVASLAARPELLGRVERTVAERDRVRAELLALGFDVPPSEANFLWLPLGSRAQEFAAACASAGVDVRPYPGDGVRVTVGTVADNDAFLAAAGTYRP